MKKLILLTSMLIVSWQVYASSFASMYIANSSTDIITGTLTANTEIQVSGFSALQNNNWTYSSNTLVAGTSSAGKYLVKYSISFAASDGLWSVNLYKNSDIMSEIVNKRKISSASGTDVGNISASGIIDVSASDVIQLKMESDADGTVLVIKDAQVVLIPVEAGTNPETGEMYMNNNTNSQSINTSWQTLENFTASSNSNKITFSNNVLSIPTGASGYYFVSLSCSFNGNGPNDYNYGISINNNTPSQLLMQRRISGNADYGNASLCGIVYLNAGDDVRVQVKGDASSLSVTVSNANLALFKLNGLTASSHGSNIISSNTYSNSLPAGSWVTEDHFSAGTYNNNWTGGSSTISPSLSAAGYYYLSFSGAITYAEAENINDYIYPEVAIFVNDVIQPNLVVERKLQKKDRYDYGSLAGGGFVRISSTSDNIKMKFKSDAGKKFMAIDANVSLIQISSISNLDIQFIQFTLNQNNDGNLLSWIADAKDVKSLQLESSIDGNSYKIIKSYELASPSSYIHEKYLDQNLSKNKRYYRLCAINMDGSKVFSKVVVSDDKLLQLNNIRVNSSGIILDIQSYEATAAACVIISSNGAIAFKKQLTLAPNSNRILLNVSDLASGVYILQLNTANKRLIKRIYVAAP